MIGLAQEVFAHCFNNTWHFVDKYSVFAKEAFAHDMGDWVGWQLYCIYDKTSGAVKVGTSTKPVERLATLQTGNPNPLYLGIVRPLENDDGTSVTGLQAKRLERVLHDKLSHLRMSGGSEWFKTCDEQRRIVEQHWDSKTQGSGRMLWHWASPRT